MKEGFYMTTASHFSDWYVKNNKLYVTFVNGRKAKFNLVIDNKFKVSLNAKGKYLDGNKENCYASYVL